jgi:hypothetical protein
MLINTDHLSFRILEVMEGDAQGAFAIVALVTLVTLVLAAIIVCTISSRLTR